MDPSTSGPVGEPPPSLDLELHATWHELAGEAPVNVLRSADRALLEMATVLRFTIRTTPRAELEPALVSQYIKCLSMMGMSPVDRSKVHAPKETPANPFSKFANKVAIARRIN